MNGRRREERCDILCGATIIAEGRGPITAEIMDLTPRGCRLDARCDLAEGVYVTLMLGSVISISGQVTWNDGGAMGIEFCARLLPKAIMTLANVAAVTQAA